MRARDAAGARYDAVLLLAHATGRDPAWLLAHDDEELPAEVAARFTAAIDRRAAGEPVPYLTGSAGFYGRSFAVDSNVLVPRPETECAIDAVLEHVRAAAPGVRLCDVGTGSGALAVTLACELPAAHVTAIDVSPAALAIARRNADDHGVADRVRFVLGDNLAAAPGPYAGIVANLPYLKTREMPSAPDPVSFEPRLALDGGSDGLETYRALLRTAPAALEPGGILVMEAGPATVPALARAARAAFARDTAPSIVCDLAGLERLVVVRLQK